MSDDDSFSDPGMLQHLFHAIRKRRDSQRRVPERTQPVSLQVEPDDLALILQAGRGNKRWPIADILTETEDEDDCETVGLPADLHIEVSGRQFDQGGVPERPFASSAL